MVQRQQNLSIIKTEQKIVAQDSKPHQTAIASSCVGITLLQYKLICGCISLVSWFNACILLHLNQSN